MLTYTHDTPSPNMPRPKSNPRNAARRGEASNQVTNSSAGARTANGNRLNGANASGSKRPAAKAARSLQTAGGGKALRVVLRLRFLFNRSHFQQINTSAVGAQHFKSKAIDIDFFPPPGNMPQAAHDQSSDGFNFLMSKLRVKTRIEIGQIDERLDHILAPIAGHDHAIVFYI